MSHWLQKYRPEDIKEYSLTGADRLLVDCWIEDFKNKVPGTKPALLINGPTGSGKTTLANYILEKHNYVVKEFNVGDRRTDKNIQRQFTDLLNNRSIIDMFKGGTAKTGILMDDVDILSSSSDDKGGLSCFVSIVSGLDKKNTPNKKKKKDASTPYMSDSPIICTTTTMDDKKVRELTKSCCQVTLKPLPVVTVVKIIKNIAEKEKLLINDETVSAFVNGAPRPLNIRNLIIDLYDLYLGARARRLRKQEKELKEAQEANNKKLEREIIAKIQEPVKSTSVKILNRDAMWVVESMKNRMVDIKSYTCATAILGWKLDYGTCIRYYEMDTLTIPLLVHENYITKTFERRNQQSRMLSVIRKISQSLSNYDYYQNAIFKNQCRQLSRYVGLYSSAIPNYWINALGDGPENSYRCRASSLLNRMSLFFNNRKLINGLKASSLLSTSDMLYLAELIIWNIFSENGNVDRGLELMIKNNLGIETLETLLRINKMENNEYRKLLTAKFRQELEKKIDAETWTIRPVYINKRVTPPKQLKKTKLPKETKPSKEVKKTKKADKSELETTAKEIKKVKKTKKVKEDIDTPTKTIKIKKSSPKSNQEKNKEQISGEESKPKTRKVKKPKDNEDNVRTIKIRKSVSKSGKKSKTDCQD